MLPPSVKLLLVVDATYPVLRPELQSFPVYANEVPYKFANAREDRIDMHPSRQAGCLNLHPFHDTYRVITLFILQFVFHAK